MSTEAIVRSRVGRAVSVFLALAVMLATGVPILASASWYTGFTPTRVSVDNNGENDYGRGSRNGAISEDGRYVAFVSGVPLAEEDDNYYQDVFVRDLVMGTTTLVSVASDGTTGDDSSGDGGSGEPVISKDGRYVAFDSHADNLVPDDDTSYGDGDRDIFVHDMVSGETTRVSHFGYGDVSVAGANEVTMDDAGAKVGFYTRRDLVPEDDNGYKDIFVVTMATGAIVRASVASDGTQANSDSYEPHLSGDGRYVVFSSYANNLVANDDNGEADVFRHDLVTGETVLVSQSTAGVQDDNDGSWDPRVSNDGRFVVWETDGKFDPADTDTNDSGESDIYMRDMVTGVTKLLTKEPVDELGNQRGSSDPDISGDGTIVSFKSGHGYAKDDTNHEADVYIYHIPSDSYFCVSRDYTGQIPDVGSGSYDDTFLSDGGDWIAFDAYNPLVPDDTYSGEGEKDVYVRQLRRDVPDGVTRVAGSSRYGTAVQVSMSTFPDGANTVVIATGVNWPDALAGSSLAGAVGAPILLTYPGSLPGNVKAEIERLGAKNAYILGGTDAVSMAVEDELDAMLGGFINRLDGADRYETAQLIADKTIDVGAWDGTVLVTTGGNFADALAGAPLAAGLDWPIVLANPGTGAVYIPDGIDKAIILGGTAAVSSTTETLLKNSTLANDEVMRLAGANRFATAAMVAEHGVESGLLWSGVGIATGEDFPDGLTGGVALGLERTVLLLTEADTLAPSAKKKLTDNKSEIEAVQFLGGTAAVSSGVEAQVKSILGM